MFRFKEISFWTSILLLLKVHSTSLIVPSTKHLSLAGGLTILADNDLRNDPKPHSGAILINGASTFDSASASCKLLTEALWTPKEQNFFNGLNSSLAYQVHQDLFERDQLFWVSRATKDTCRAIDTKGRSATVNCTTKLPALCTQSAPVSTWNFSDVSTTLHITHQVGRQSFTGYRDFYVWKFFGIRYAAQPERFTHSKLFEGTGLASAINRGNDCKQVTGNVQVGSEDCLNLNVWTPYLPPSSPSKQKLKPVMFFIYGGSFISGSATNFNTDGTNLASRGDVVVVMLNYRVGNFGFLAFDDGVHTGNYGIGDMVTALKWVSKNIKAFGGDPDNVTIFGESAGAVAVKALLASPKAKSLFANAMILSAPSGYGPAGPYGNWMTVKQYAESITKGVLNVTGCEGVSDQVRCLRNVDVSVMASLSPVDQYPVLDDLYIPRQFAINNSKGYTKDINLLTGTNRNETGIFLSGILPGVDLDTAIFMLKSAFGFDIAPLIASGIFPIQSDPTSQQIFALVERILTDASYLCGELAFEYSAVKHKVFNSLYSFTFNRTYSPVGFTSEQCNAPITADRPFGDPDGDYYKCHVGQQIIMFGNVRRQLPDRDGLDVEFEQLIVDSWGAFARTGNPNPDRGWLKARGFWGTLAETDRVGKWKELKTNRLENRMLQWGSKDVAFPERKQCEMLGLGLEHFE